MLATVFQQAEVTASVNRTEVAVGDTLVLSIRVEATGADIVRITDPDITGLDVYATRDLTSVQFAQGVASRVTTRLLLLRAVRSGAVVIGPVRVTQGRSSAQTDPIALRVADVDNRATAAISSAIRELMRRAPPPLGSDEVTVVIVPSADSVNLGEQVNLLLAAWFPREVREHLRNPPTLEPPRIQGAWTYEQNLPVGVISSQRVRGVWYDLFAHHQTVFPLAPGVLEIDRAAVSYSIPLTLSFLSRELRHVVQSEPIAVEVMAQPGRGRPALFSGAAAASLNFSVDVSDVDLRVGDATTVTAALTGRGNVALWPEPLLKWPEEIRVYPGGVSVDISRDGGVIRGTKTFRYLLVPDSVGTHRIPSAVYEYFDLDMLDYKEARAAPIELVAREGANIAASSRSAPPPLLSPEEPGPVQRFFRVVPFWVWVVVALVLPLIVALSRIRLPKRPTTEPQTELARGALFSLDREFRLMLQKLVAHAGLLEGDELADALRAAGIETAIASHAVRVRERLRRAVYGPGGVSDVEELEAEVHEVMRVLLGESSAEGRRVAVTAVVIAALMFTGNLHAQHLTAERLYEAGAIGAAADSFRVRVDSAPSVAAHWYNLGNAYYRLGEDARARIAWLRAARIDPRSRSVNQALRLNPPVDKMSKRMLWISPITAAEGVFLAAVSWIVGWLLVLLRTKKRYYVAALSVAVAAAGYVGLVRLQYSQPVAVVVGRNVPLREAPFGSSRVLSYFSDGSAVRVERARASWLLVSRGSLSGWVLSREVERI